eukprot:1159329-Pelagomonas_calceolata.AAC.2
MAQASVPASNLIELSRACYRCITDGANLRASYRHGRDNPMMPLPYPFQIPSQLVCSVYGGKNGETATHYKRHWAMALSA